MLFFGKGGLFVGIEGICAEHVLTLCAWHIEIYFIKSCYNLPDLIAKTIPACKSWNNLTDFRFIRDWLKTTTATSFTAS